MGWIYVGSDRYINVNHVISICRYESSYVITLDNGEVIETTILLANLGIADVIHESTDLPF